jgi:hypothetical protein
MRSLHLAAALTVASSTAAFGQQTDLAALLTPYPGTRAVATPLT